MEDSKTMPERKASALQKGYSEQRHLKTSLRTMLYTLIKREDALK